ncbi:MAG: alpha/beta hydrolase [Lentisphaeria bacterium]|nr:alpha/beta hydrolase [Lentisphaeria bacterium]
MRIQLRNHPEAAPTGIPEDDFQPYIDTFLIDSVRDPLGAVLILPGGGYHHRAYHEGDPVARKFNALGYHAFVLQYRVAPYRYPAPQRDVIRAVKLIRANAPQWYVEKLAVLGFSAGGHLAGCGAILADSIDAAEGDEADDFSGRTDAMILCYPVISLSKANAHVGSGNCLLGEEASLEERAKLDLQDIIDEQTPPAFLWHTAEDQAVHVSNSMDFASAMWKKGKACELHIFPHGPHGRGLAEGRHGLKKWPEMAADFLEHTCGFARG